MSVAERGAIQHEEAYARGKMIDHSSWQRGEKIVRLVTPSDIDVCFDNGGKVLFCEFSRVHDCWRDLKAGQRRLYESCVATGPHCAVLCKHSVTLDSGRAIDSRTDVDSFQALLYDHDVVYAPVLRGNESWQRLVLGWFENPLAMRRKLLGRAAA